MSILWIETGSDWSSVELAGAGALRLSGGLAPSAEPIDGRPSASFNADDVVVKPSDDRGAHWALICRPGACQINGAPTMTGFRCLVHKDEIVLPNTELRILFSTEAVATVTAHKGDPISCPRCHQSIADGTPVVVCPNCGVEHHEVSGVGDGEALPCWTYSAKCAVCQGSTALNSGYSFPPEGW